LGAVGLDGRIGKAAALVLCGHIGMDEEGLRAGRLQERHRLPPLFIGPVHDDDPGAFAGKAEGAGSADSGPTARNHDNRMFHRHFSKIPSFSDVLRLW
jgi:hypothetical protein